MKHESIEHILSGHLPRSIHGISTFVQTNKVTWSKSAAVCEEKSDEKAAAGRLNPVRKFPPLTPSVAISSKRIVTRAELLLRISS